MEDNIINWQIKEYDKMEKTFREVIADIKEGEVWESENNSCDVIIVKDMTGIQIRDFKDNALVFFSDSWKFKLRRKQYTFTEAWKAYEEGKEIESCVRGGRYQLEKYSTVSEVNSFIWFDEIRGKWYINN